MFIIIIKGTNIGAIFPLNKIGIVIIGRGKECNIRILDPKVSRAHCQIEGKDSGFYIKDLGSTNKTFVNKEIIDTEKKLEINTTIDIGDTTLFFSDQKEIPIKSVEDYDKIRINQTMRFNLPPDK